MKLMVPLVAFSWRKSRRVQEKKWVNKMESLLEDVKNYLDITWNDDQTNKKLQGIIYRGQKYLNRIAGKELDFNVEDQPKELLLEYCRYVRSNALEEYQKNYLQELLSLQLSEEVAQYETSNTNTQ